MEFAIILFISIILLILLWFLLGTSAKKIKVLATNEELEKIAKKYPDNITICKKYLKILNNEKVEIEENKDSESSLYIAVTNKISIGNVSKTYTRIQTIAHECLHSVQDRRILLFNFMFSNIYLLYYLVICILAILNLLPFKMMFLAIFILFAFVWFIVRMYLENDAMIKAKYLAKEYMEEEKFSSKEETNKMINNFGELNNVGIKYIHYRMYLTFAIKLIIFLIICIIV